jgi:hypothetical protein
MEGFYVSHMAFSLIKAVKCHPRLMKGFLAFLVNYRKSCFHPLIVEGSFLMNEEALVSSVTDEGRFSCA